MSRTFKYKSRGNKEKKPKFEKEEKKTKIRDKYMKEIDDEEQD